MDYRCDIPQIWPFPLLILIRGLRQTKRFNSPVPHPPLTHTPRRLSTGSMLTFSWEPSALSAAICLISYCNSQCRGVRGRREWEKKKARWLQCCLWHSVIQACLYRCFCEGVRLQKNKHKGSFSKPADWLLKRSHSRNVEAINEYWKTNYSFNRTV